MIKAVIVTNQEQCVLGVFDESCIMINVEETQLQKASLRFKMQPKKLQHHTLMR